MSDGELLDRYLEQRDEIAFSALVRRHGPMVWGVCQRIIGEAADADDAFQATFLILVRKAAGIKSREAVGSWLYGVACHAALKARGTRARMRAKEKQVTSMPEPAMEQRNDRDELQRLLDQELSALPDIYRLPVVLCELEGRSRKEVAAQLKIPEGTLSSRLTTAHEKLAKRLARHGLAVSGASLAGLLTQSAASATVPAAVVSSTIKTATLVAASKGAVAGVASTKVAALTEGVLKAMLITKLKTVIALVMMLSVAALASTMLAWSQAGDKGDTGEPAAHVEKSETKQAVKPKRAESDTDRFQGSWTLVSEERDGKLLPAQQIKKYYTFAGDELRLSIEGGDLAEPITHKTGFRLNPTKNPKEIDGREDEGKPGIKGVYVLDGDTLKVCIAPPGKDRPTKFLTNPGTNETVINLMRVGLQEPMKAKADAVPARAAADAELPKKDDQADAAVPDKENALKGTARSRAVEAIKKAGGTYGVRLLGGKEFAATAKRLGYDERSYYDVLRLTFGRPNGKEPLGDAGLEAVAEHIATFPGLEDLDLRGNDLTDKGLASLPPLPKLQVLRLDGEGITDAVVTEVAVRFPALTRLELAGSAVTAEGEAALRKLLPKCKVNR